MASHLGVSKSAVQKYLRINGLTPPKSLLYQFRSEAMKGKTTFTEAEDNYIRQTYLKLPVKQIASKMGRSYTGVMGRLSAMGLQIPPEIIQRNIAAGRIQKGNVPVNKGKKMPADVYEKVKATMFQKGNRPPNTKSRDGIVVERLHKRTGFSYKYVRISLGNWVLLHRHKWEQKNGPIPKGHCIAFKDGNTLNCHLKNLFIISQRDNRLRNSGSTLLSDAWVAQTITRKNKALRETIINTRPDLIELKRQSIILKRTINENRNNSSNS